MAIKSLRGKEIVINTTITNFHYSSGYLSSIIKRRFVQSYAIPPISSEETHRGKWSKLLLFIPGAITFGLGTWQIFRRQDKIAMLEYRQKRFEMEPLKWTQVSSTSKKLNSLEFRRIKCKGLFDEKRSIYIGPRSRSISGVTENGYYLITPLMPVPDDPESVQTPILVNRGWVPSSWKDRSIKVSQNSEQPLSIASPPCQENERSWWKFWYQHPKVIEDKVGMVTPVEVVGVVRDSENPSIFVPANEPTSYQWFYVDVPAIAHVSGLPEDSLYIEYINEDINHSNPYPIPKEANVLICSSVMPQDHLRYTLTWYSLSTGVTYMAFKRIRPRKIQR